MKTIEERFWAKVEKTDSCWNWTAYVDACGYGFFRPISRKSHVRAHRYSYTLVHGEITPGMVLDHICHNPKCVNPDHLREVTNKQNSENRVRPPRHNTSGVMGVTWIQQCSRYRASVRHENKVYYAGHYTTIAEAEAAVIAKRNELFSHNDADRISA